MIVAPSDDNCTNDTMILQPASFSLPTISYPLLWGDISSKGKLSVCRSRYREDYWRFKKKEDPLCPYFRLNDSHFTTENKVGKCRLYCPISSLLVFSNCDIFLSKSTSFFLHDNFPSNLPQTGPTLSSHMLYIPSAPSWRPNLLQKSFPFPTCLPSWHLLAAHYTSQTILPTLKSLETPLQAGSLLHRLIRSLHPYLTDWVWSSGEQLGEEFHTKEAKP